MPESEEYIRGMRAACERLRVAAEDAQDIKYTLTLLRLEASRLEAENAQRRMSRIEMPDGGGW